MRHDIKKLRFFSGFLVLLSLHAKRFSVFFMRDLFNIIKYLNKYLQNLIVTRKGYELLLIVIFLNMHTLTHLQLEDIVP